MLATEPFFTTLLAKKERRDKSKERPEAKHDYGTVEDHATNPLSLLACDR
jgi:hypothetical protein